MSPNQFWQHKNHIVVIEAVKLLKDKGILVNVVFTGKENDYRNTNYVDDLKKKVLSYNLDDQILFLGFIDRIDQLLLMKNAIGIIQPSLFEGWSTVVEDSKALNQTIIASDIKVHREQLDISAYYFDSMNAFDLANILMELYEMPDNRIKYECNYDENISRFSRDFLFILNDQMNEKTVHNYN
jgi:glycosyltransferase involved in cell wall biosynthesis